MIRSVGFSLGSALTTSVLASRTPAALGQPAEGGYTLVLWTSAVVSVAAAGLAWILPAQGARQGREEAAEEIPADPARR